jgi:D-sedoheptulose 7-phosphate isomerase
MATQTIEEIAARIIKCFKSSHKLFIVGNGGSAAEASHFATELLCKFKKERKPLPAITLNDPAITSAIGNDFGFQYIFSRQIEALGNKGDIILSLSTSGTSPNILEAHKAAKKLGMEIIKFPTNKNLTSETDLTQEEHLSSIHLIAELVERAFL